jgi:hypothetical protein
MAILGYADAKLNTPPTLWDQGEISKVQLASGQTLETMIAEVQTALDMVNSDFINDPYYAGLLAIQDNPAIKAATDSGDDADFIKTITDHSKLDPGHGITTGWTLPIYDKGGALGWTMKGLRDRSLQDIQADVRQAINGIKKDLAKSAHVQQFKSTAVLVGSTAGASVPFCDGGTADASYVPLQYDGQTFANTHSHFLRQAALNDANVALAIKHLREHGHMGPYTITASLTDSASWNGLTGFYKPKWEAVDFMATAGPRAQFSQNDEYGGIFECADGIAFVRFTARVPTNYYAVHKAYGQLDPRNPLRMRINPLQGYGFAILPGNWVGAPHLMAVVNAEYGYGVGEDRTNTVAVFIAGAGNYVDPVIS